MINKTDEKMPHGFLRKTMSVMLTAAFSFTLLVGYSFSTEAASVSYSGKGTKSDPFLVQTAAQLDGMRNNLSACYKLDNTIDLSSWGSFSPIGYLQNNTAFTGSFSCDTSADGAPLYVIKGLNVSVTSGADTYKKQNELYKKDDYQRRWEAGLFGYTSGAVISNIAVLDAVINNDTIGMNSSYNYIPNMGMDEQAAAVIIGICKDTTVKNCTATGTVTSKSNHTGGIIGCVSGRSSVSYCFANVNINSTGLWNIGGFAGSVLENAVVENCCNTGTVSDPSGYTCGGFCGCSAPTATISNCYSTANGASYAFDGSKAGKESYCYATGSNGKGDAAANDSTSTNCYILSSAGVIQPNSGFSPASKAQIVSAFTGNNSWNTSGELPTLNNVNLSLSAAAYTPREITQQAGTADNNITAQTESSVTSSEETEVLLTVDELIKAVDDISDASKAGKGDIDNALLYKKSYDALTSEEQLAFGDERYFKMLEFYNTSGLETANYITKNVKKLPSADKLTADDAEKVEELYALYKKLPSDLREKVPYDVQKKLEKCEERALELKESGSVLTNEIDPAINKMEMIILVLLGIIDLAALAGTVFIVVLTVKMYKSQKPVVSEDVEENADI